jgi:hypothetical protein
MAVGLLPALEGLDASAATDAVDSTRDRIGCLASASAGPHVTVCNIFLDRKWLAPQPASSLPKAPVRAHSRRGFFFGAPLSRRSLLTLGTNTRTI